MKTYADIECLMKRWPGVAISAIAAILAFHSAYAHNALSVCIVVFLFLLCRLGRVKTPRLAFYSGLLVGFGIYAPQLNFFWTIFGLGALALWFVLAFWIGLFVLLAHYCSTRLSPWIALLLISCLWTGLEYFRSELYFLRFSWLSVGYAFADSPSRRYFAWLGAYGISFVLMLAVTSATLLAPKRLLPFVCFILCLGVLVNVPETASTTSRRTATDLPIAGVQLEFPEPPEIKSALNKLIERYPEAELLVLSEYTLDSPVPDWLKAWCSAHKKYLIVGGKKPVPPSNFYNTAFVVSPSGQIVFEQVKSVPIQFFQDGLPALEQKLWNSPWGQIGICICYDLSYRRVTDAFVRQGAKALIVPTMDVADWGERQHELHSRVAPMRGAEHRIPIFRLASSGISQCVDATGRVISSAPFPGQGEFVFGHLDLSGRPRVPIDFVLAPLCVAVTAVTMAWLLVRGRSRYFRGRRSSVQNVPVPNPI